MKQRLGLVVLVCSVWWAGSAVAASVGPLGGSAARGAAPVPAVGTAGLSNEAFAAEVKRLRGQMQREESAVADAAGLCAYLPRHRADDEPRCVALHGHLRARSAARLAPEPPGAPLPMPGTAPAPAGSPDKHWLPGVARCLAAVVQGAA